MKKLLLIFSIGFCLLTFAGAIYVLVNHGTVNAGYAVVPMVLSLACSSGYQAIRLKEKNNDGR